MTGTRIATICQAISTLTISIVIGFIYNWRLATFTLILMPFIAIATLLNGMIQSKQAKEEGKSIQKSSKLAIEVMNSMRTVVSLHKEGYAADKFGDYLDEHFE